MAESQLTRNLRHTLIGPAMIWTLGILISAYIIVRMIEIYGESYDRGVLQVGSVIVILLALANIFFVIRDSLAFSRFVDDLKELTEAFSGSDSTAVPGEDTLMIAPVEPLPAPDPMPDTTMMWDDDYGDPVVVDTAGAM